MKSIKNETSNESNLISIRKYTFDLFPVPQVRQSFFFPFFFPSYTYSVSFSPGDTSSEKKEDEARKSSPVTWGHDLENEDLRPTFEVSDRSPRGSRTITNVPSLFQFSCFFSTLSLSLHLYHFPPSYSFFISFFFLDLFFPLNLSPLFLFLVSMVPSVVLYYFLFFSVCFIVRHLFLVEGCHSLFTSRTCATQSDFLFVSLTVWWTVQRSES